MKIAGKRGAFSPVDFAVFAILLVGVTYPIVDDVITNQSLTGTDLLIATTSLTLLLVLLIVRIAQAMKKS